MRCAVILWRIGLVAALPVQLAKFTLWPAASLACCWISESAAPCLSAPVTEPIGVGAPSQTFLQNVWQRVSVLPAAMDYFQTSQMPASYSAAPEWLAPTIPGAASFRRPQK